MADSSKSDLTGFLYDLMRDHLPIGVVEGMVREVERCRGMVPVYSNPHLARYAGDVAARLLATAESPAPEQGEVAKNSGP